MSLVDYLMDIGITYLIFPAITIGMGHLLEQRQRATMSGTQSA